LLNKVVYLVGLGIPESDTLTLAGAAVLKRCKMIFSGGPGLYKQDFLSGFCPDVRRIKFENDARDQVAEIRSKLNVFFAAAEGGGPIAFVTYAHAMFYDTACEWIMEGCRQRGLSYEVISGVSAIDAVFSTLKQDLRHSDGVHAGDVEHFLGTQLDPKAYALIFRSHVELSATRKLFGACLRIYPKTHRVAFVRCENDPRLGEKVVWLELNDCRERVEELDHFTSVLIPPLRKGPL
jgi:uncharacterized protein YabN with tetrapyrrole methylase and pyrophosphatase domain